MEAIPVGTIFRAPVQTGPGAHPASYTVGTGSFPAVKWPERGVDHPPPYSAEVKKKSKSIPLLPLRAFVSCSRVDFTFYFGSTLSYHHLRHVSCDTLYCLVCKKFA